VDVENLMGTTVFGIGGLRRVEARYRAVAAVAPNDHVVIASSHATASAAWFGWQAGRRLVRSGPDGADLELLKVMRAEDLASRFDRVVIASGDGMFAGAAAQLQACGCAVTVVVRSLHSVPATLLRCSGRPCA
jgi:hypothetical protein